MQKNIGNAERIIRFVAGASIIAVGVYFQSWWGAIGIIPIFTSLTGWCPPYHLLGINTCSAQQKDSG